MGNPRFREVKYLALATQQENPPETKAHTFTLLHHADFPRKALIKGFKVVLEKHIVDFFLQPRQM